ncbi:hypothetical protein SAMN05444722_2575 [Rhodovulum sp. ES.010]|uniref:hypothetical protein n=1 Tax=Rhodovulum sp. ES.010 TaxID=1882821 RepID=UPI00092A3746|nr:hypothetical protein [Rhodovulum sp. ES.010]SIO48700.1 hypothetical protein SAMN05444722_2575 [Rhodovulum sp. ES.010]
MENIAKAIEEVVRDRFADVRIVRVDVEEGQDHDGDQVFFVRVVFDSEIKDLDAAKLSGITRHLRSRLFDLGDERFPYTRFISQADFEGEAA